MKVSSLASVNGSCVWRRVSVGGHWLEPQLPYNPNPNPNPNPNSSLT